MENNIAIEVKNLSFEYSPTQQVLNDISFKVKQGEYCCLIGHNGSGKSTLAKLIIGLLIQSKGEIYIFNEELTDSSLYSIRKKLGIIFQNPDNQFVGTTVKEDIAFGLENDCVPENLMQGIIDKYAKEVDMYNYLDRQAANLSGGQKQRVAIAGVLARKPSIFIMDEATSMLDPKGKREILNLIHKLKKEEPKLTIISITHDVEEAYNSDHVIVLEKGKVVLDDKPNVVFNNRDQLEKLKLEIPFFLRLDDELKKLGIDVSGAKNFDELKENLCKLK